ncbi:hypothetical protein SUGI_0464060 [Cryptomeria japonica]|nr:hypothetical protein SUGI_0464060 [Cryptomeria japonica]
MLLQMQMHCGFLLGFVICVCLVGFIAAKYDPEKCGDFEVSCPFWIHKPDCGYPGFNIICKEDEYTRMLAPFFRVYLRKNINEYFDHYKIMEINYTGCLIINSTSLRANSCGANSSEIFFRPREPFTISKSNKFVVIGCTAFGTY